MDLLKETRAVCDDDDELHCWMNGIPYEYWTQYEDVFQVLVELAGYATAAGFRIAFLFLLGTFFHQKWHSVAGIIGGSFVGAFLIAVTIVSTLIPVVGFSILLDVNLTGFSNMAFVLSVGFAVEYSVQIFSRWMRADMSHLTSLDRAEHTMSFLMLPTFVSFISSTIRVVCLAFSPHVLSRVNFFRPTILVMCMSYWYGYWFLPVLLSHLDFDMVKMGKPVPVANPQGNVVEDASGGEGDTEEAIETHVNPPPTASDQDEEIPEGDQDTEEKQVNIFPTSSDQDGGIPKRDACGREGFTRLAI
jgi:hypothetical protein